MNDPKELLKTTGAAVASAAAGSVMSQTLNT